ncbi:MAG: aminomethyltransferase family protein [Candidatus Methylomirabilia bacterium]
MMPTGLPLHELHVASGASVEEVCGWLLPAHYGSPAAEHRAVREAAGLADQSLIGKLEVTGRDRVSFLQGMVTNDLAARSPGQACPAAFLDAQGKIQALLTVLVLEDRLLIELPPGLTEKTLRTLDKFLIREKVVFTDVTEAFQVIAIHGPAAARVLGRLTGSEATLEPFQHVEGAVAGIPVWFCRVDEFGVPGYQCWVTAERGAELWRQLLERGRPHGLVPVGTTALAVLRVEAGIPSFGHDVDGSTLLMEAPLEHLVSYTKGCYIGQEVVARIKYRGHVNRFLTGLTLEGERVPASGALVLTDGSEVGHVTSAIRSLALDQTIALAMLRREQQAAGTPVTVKDQDQTIPARVTALPFISAA